MRSTGERRRAPARPAPGRGLGPASPRTPVPGRPRPWCRAGRARPRPGRSTRRASGPSPHRWAGPHPVRTARPAAPWRRGCRGAVPSADQGRAARRRAARGAGLPAPRRRAGAPRSPRPPQSRSAVISCAAASPERGTTSLSTEGVPSAPTAALTKASVASAKAGPTLMDQSRSRSAIRPGNPSSHHWAPAARALMRTTAGTVCTDPSLSGPHQVGVRRARPTG